MLQSTQHKRAVPVGISWAGVQWTLLWPPLAAFSVEGEAIWGCVRCFRTALIRARGCPSRPSSLVAAGSLEVLRQLLGMGGATAHPAWRQLSSSFCLSRANALEEQLKEQELRACEMVLEETRRQKELLCKMEREKSIEIENLQAR